MKLQYSTNGARAIEKYDIGSFLCKGIWKQTADQKISSELKTKVKDTEQDRNVLKRHYAFFPKTVGDVLFYKKSWKNISDWKNM